MSDQGALFTDPPAEVRAKRTYVLAPERTEAMARIVDHDRDWGAAFDREVAVFAALGDPFTVYDVLAKVGYPDANPAVVGARMNSNAKRGIVVRDGWADRVTHGDAVRRWRGSKGDP